MWNLWNHPLEPPSEPIRAPSTGHPRAPLNSLRIVEPVEPVEPLSRASVRAGPGPFTSHLGRPQAIQNCRVCGTTPTSRSSFGPVRNFPIFPEFFPKVLRYLRSVTRYRGPDRPQLSRFSWSFPQKSCAPCARSPTTSLTKIILARVLQASKQLHQERDGKGRDKFFTRASFEERRRRQDASVGVRSSIRVQDACWPTPWFMNSSNVENTIRPHPQDDTRHAQSRPLHQRRNETYVSRGLLVFLIPHHKPGT